MSEAVAEPQASPDTADELQADIDLLMDQIVKLETRVDDLEAEVTEKDATIEYLENRVAELDARTDLMSLVDDVDEMEGKERSVALLQHLFRSARSDAAASGTQSASVDRDHAEEVLHYPDVDRTTIYDDMRRCVRLVGDEDVCYYDSDGDASRLVLNLENGQLPETVHSKFNGGG